MLRRAVAGTAVDASACAPAEPDAAALAGTMAAALRFRLETAFGQHLVGFPQQFNKIGLQGFPEPVVGGILDCRRRAIAATGAGAATPCAGQIGGRIDDCFGVALQVGIVDPIVAQERSVGLNRQVLAIELIAKIDLTRNPVQDLGHGLVTHVHGDRTGDTGVNVDVELGIACQRKQEVLHADIAHDHAVKFLAHAGTRWRGQQRRRHEIGLLANNLWRRIQVLTGR